MKVQPLHDWVLVQMDKFDTIKQGIIVLEDSSLNTIRTGTVLATGKGKFTATGARGPLGVEMGEKVAFYRWNMEHKSGKQVTTFLEGVGDDVGMIRVSDILFAFPAGEKVQVG